MKSECDSDDFIPARKVYEEFGLPRSLVRTLADNGKIRRKFLSIDNINKLVLYSRSDLKRFKTKATEDF